MLALPDCALTPMVGWRPQARDAPQVRYGVLALARAVHAGPRCRMRRGPRWRRCAAARAQMPRRQSAPGRLGRWSDPGGTNSASPRSCMDPTTVVRFTLPQRSPVPISVPCTCTAPARGAARVLATPVAIGVAVKTEFRTGKLRARRQTLVPLLQDWRRHWCRRRHDAAYLWRTTCLVNWWKWSRVRLL